MSLATFMIGRTYPGQVLDGWNAYCSARNMDSNPNVEEEPRAAWLDGFHGGRDEFANGTMTEAVRHAYAVAASKRTRKIPN